VSGIFYIAVMESSRLPKNLMEDKLVASILRLQVSQPPDYDWKEDYAKALEEKYENIRRR
jgi:hypothetical protein